MDHTRPPLDYLIACSQAGLESYELSRLNRISNLRKELREVLEEWIEAEVNARVARWLLECQRGESSGAGPAAFAPAASALLGQRALPFLPPMPGEDVSASEPDGDAPWSAPAPSRAPSPANGGTMVRSFLHAEDSSRRRVAPAAPVENHKGEAPGSAAMLARRPTLQAGGEAAALRDLERRARRPAGKLRRALPLAPAACEGLARELALDGGHLSRDAAGPAAPARAPLARQPSAARPRSRRAAPEDSRGAIEMLPFETPAACGEVPVRVSPGTPAPPKPRPLRPAPPMRALPRRAMICNRRVAPAS